MHTFTTFFHKKAEPSRIRFNLAIVVVCEEPAVDLHTVKNKNHTGINRFRDVDKEGFLVSPGGHFHKKILVELFASARLKVFPAYINLKVFNAPFQGLFVSGEEHIKPVSFDGAASVENFHSLAVAIAGD